jgi:PhnB protein
MNNKLPRGYHTVIPYLIVKGADQAIEFYKKAFNAKEKGRITISNGKIMHAEIEIGDSIVMLTDEMPEWGVKSPISLGGTAVGIALYVENVDSVFEQAIAAGARVERPIEDQFYGDRIGTLIDPFGHKWSVATHKEDVSFEIMQERSDAFFSKQQN